MTWSQNLVKSCLPLLLKEGGRGHASKILHSLNPKRFLERGLPLDVPFRLALGQGQGQGQGQERQVERPQFMAIGGMESDMGGSAAEVRQGVPRKVGVEAELDDDIENAVTRGLQAVVPHCLKAQR